MDKIKSAFSKRKPQAASEDASSVFNLNPSEGIVLSTRVFYVHDFEECSGLLFLSHESVEFKGDQ